MAAPFLPTPHGDDILSLGFSGSACAIGRLEAERQPSELGVRAATGSQATQQLDRRNLPMRFTGLAAVGASPHDRVP